MSHSYYSISFPLFFIFSILVITIARDAPQTQTQTHAITSCLTLNNVNNFTTFPNINYYKLLNFSIQNLRFLEPTVPKPMLIILPESADQLARTVLCCREASWEFRVRCGGHSYEGTSSVTTDGAPFAIIDMMNLNRVRIDPESETAWVEGGATLGETYYAISRWSDVHGFSAGSCPTVGVGGHISGGGFGLLSRKYGLAADNAVDALLVDAEGRVLDRRAMGEDVFWALRGGGGGVWGIVFAWKIRLVTVPKTVTSFVASRTQHVAKLVEKWQHVAPHLPPEFYLSVFVGSGLPGANPDAGVSATFKGFYLGSATKTMTIINKWFPELDIVSEQESREMSWVESVLFFSGLSGTSSVSNLKDRYWPPQDRNYFKAKADYVRSPISIRGIKLAMEILEKEPKGYVILDPYGGIMDNISSEAIAFPHRRGNLFTIQYLVEWKEEDHHKNKSDEYLDWIRGFYNSMSPFVSSAPRAAYINYMDLDLGAVSMKEDNYDHGDDFIRNPISSDDAVEIARLWGEKYFLKNYDRLVQAKTVIDPNNIFNNQQGIPPLSSTNLRGKTY